MSCLAPTTKQDFYRRWKNLEFGNRIRMFDTQQDLRESGYTGLVSARSKGIAGGGRTAYGIKAFDAAFERYYADMTFNESAPDDVLLFQGELMHGCPEGYYLFGSTTKLPMRQAMLQGVQYHGVRALGLLKYYCWPASYDMLMELLDKYPDAVIEFGAYGKELGELPGHNVVIWEMRNY
jgi:hypothetical protein